MASSIGPGGNYFSQINQNLSKGLDSKTTENLRQTGGTAAQQRRSNVSRKGGAVDDGGGLQLSEAARKSMHSAHMEHIQGHEHELAQQAGLQEFDPESNEEHELHAKRGYERDQEEKAEATQQGKVPDGYSKVTSPTGVEQILAPDQVEFLQKMDLDINGVDDRLLGDIPQANLEAAERVVETQVKGGVSKVAQLKPVPEAQDAGRMELKGASFMTGPLEIREPGNDRLQPLQLDFPEPAQA